MSNDCVACISGGLEASENIFMKVLKLLEAFDKNHKRKIRVC